MREPTSLADTSARAATPSAPAADRASTAADSAASLFVPGRNCWRVERAHRFGVLIDADAYFRAVRRTIAAARHSIFIVGWDIDSRLRLVPDGACDGFPEPLGEFLNAVTASRKGLRTYALSWDFAMVYALEREWLPVFRLPWKSQRRLKFRLDGKHPVGGSHHQKVVVVDDAVAFVGGLDLTHTRWDTPEHRPQHPLRTNPMGFAYPPTHDVQAIVDGDVARALGELARERWRRATGKRACPAVEATDHDPWPAPCEPDVQDVDVAIARTDPAYDGRAQIEEIRALHLDAIGAARRFLFCENQYFTSSAVANAMVARLEGDDAPQMVYVGPKFESGWLEGTTMGVLRARVQQRIEASDKAGRFRAYCPVVDETDAGCINVHDKVLVVDDRLATIGSANLSNRSMGFDTECNVAIESRGDPRIAAAIAGIRNRLLGEHLGVAPARVASEIERRDGLIEAIEALRGSHRRSLVPYRRELSPEADALVPDRTVIDPERPINPERLVDELIPPDERGSVRARVVALVLAIVALGAIAAAWKYTPLSDYLQLSALVAFGERLRDQWWSPLAVIGAYVIGAVLVVPIMLTIAATGVLFGPWLGTLYACIGVIVSAVTSYTIGRHLGRETVRRIGGRRLNELSRRLAKRGLLAVFVIRHLPIAPYSIVNLVCGASHLRMRDFVLGTMLGIYPATIMTVVFVDRAVAAIVKPSAWTVAALAGAVALAIGVVLYFRRRLLVRAETSTATA
ncbi:MAG: VTT domain-containing protein [Rudaea sp.]